MTINNEPLKSVNFHTETDHKQIYRFSMKHLCMRTIKTMATVWYFEVMSHKVKAMEISTSGDYAHKWIITIRVQNLNYNKYLNFIRFIHCFLESIKSRPMPECTSRNQHTVVDPLRKLPTDFTTQPRKFNGPATRAKIRIQRLFSWSRNSLSLCYPRIHHGHNKAPSLDTTASLFIPAPIFTTKFRIKVKGKVVPVLFS
jgi:hypothetical protein